MCCNVEDVGSTVLLTRAEETTTHLAACSTLTTSRHNVSVVGLSESAWTFIWPLARLAELGHTTNSGGIGGRGGPMRSGLLGCLHLLLRYDPPGKPTATTHQRYILTREAMPPTAQ